VTIDGVSLPEALQCWESGGRNEKNHYERQHHHHRHRHHHLRHHHNQHQRRTTHDRLYDTLPQLLTGYAIQHRIIAWALQQLPVYYNVKGHAKCGCPYRNTVGGGTCPNKFIWRGSAPYNWPTADYNLPGIRPVFFKVRQIKANMSFFSDKNPKFSAEGAHPSGQILHVKEVSAGEIALTVGTVAV